MVAAMQPFFFFRPGYHRTITTKKKRLESRAKDHQEKSGFSLPAPKMI